MRSLLAPTLVKSLRCEEMNWFVTGSIPLPQLKPYDPNASPSTYGNQHEQMATNFIDKMAAALKEYKLISDNDLQQMRAIYPNLDIDTYYKAMAWAGLTGDVNGDITKAWEIFQTNNPTEAQMYRVIIAAEENATNLAPSQEKC